MEIGELIYSKRTEKGLTMKKLAELMGVSEGTISRWESGDIENIKRKKIEKLSKVLGISIYELMGWPDPDEIDISKEVSKNLEKALKDLEKRSPRGLSARSKTYSIVLDPRLKEVIDRIEQLPPEDQERMLNMIESIIENASQIKKE